MEEIELLKNRLAQSPTLLQRLKLVHRPIDPTPIMSALLEKIALGVFSPLIETHVKETSTPPDGVQALKSDFINWLTQSMGRLVGASDHAYLLLASRVDPQLHEWTLKRFIKEAENVFLEAEDKKQKMIYSYVAIGLIARAIQETAFSIPLRLYGGKEDISDGAQASLHRVLVELDKVKKAYNLKDVLEINVSTNLLYRQIALADEYVWLPLKPLIAAPLAREELLLYARESEGAKQLANQIVKSDGVILITGYRGVGKSTFINEVLDSIGEAQKYQVDEIFWEIIPVQMNVAKTANVGGALRLCIRAIYRTFRQREEQDEQILSRKEKEHLWFANLRASYKVSMSQAEAFSKSKSLQGEFGFKPGDLFVGPLKTAVMGFLPALGYKTSKDWNEKMDRTISLLDYDEDRAEEDVVQFISMLTSPRKYKNKQVAVKLVFIFDEMDKMEAKEGQDQLIRSLKNLFLTRHAVFLLVTSKEFYYMLLEDRKKEDSILGSYFSSVITVPMFSSTNTQKLLMNLLADSSGLSGKEQTLISNLARYLTYRAHGLPREIIREIRSMQQWSLSTLQPYITDRLLLPNAIQIYALIEDAIENLNNRTGTETGEKDNPLMRERIWLSEGRQEQIRRGLYILVEELLNQGSFTLDLNTKFSSYDANFSTVSYMDFYDVFDQLARKLTLIKLPDDPATLFFERVASEPASEGGQSAGKQIAIRVLPNFYSVTGRQIVQTERSGDEDLELSANPEEVMQQVNDLLGQESLFSTRRALNYLSQHPNLPVSDPIQDKLFKIFMSSSDLAYRIDSGKYLSSDGFYRNIGNAYPEAFLKEEANEAILKQLVDLTVNGATNEAKKESAFHILRDLMNRNFTRHNPLPTALFQNVLMEIEKFISRRTDAQEMLKQVLGTRNLFGQSSGSIQINGIDQDIQIGSSDSVIISGDYKIRGGYDRKYDFLKRRGGIIPANVTSVLMSLAAKAGTNLPLALLDYDHDIYLLEQETINSLMVSLSSEEIVTLWQKAIELKDSWISESIAIAILPRLSGMLPVTSDLLKAWLNDANWAEWDDEVLGTASKINPKLFYELERLFGKERDSLASQKLQSIDPVTADKSKPSAGESTAQPVGGYKNPWWLNLLLGGGMLALFLYVPFDMIQNPTIWGRLNGRTLQLLGLSLLLVGFVVLIYWLTVEYQNKPARKWYILGTLAAFGISAFLYWLLYRGGYPLTLLGEILLAVIFAGIFLVPSIAQSIIRAVMPKPKEAKAK